MSLEPKQSYRERLAAFYCQHNPEKLGDVDSLLAKYQGEEKKMFQRLYKKYDVSLTQAEGTDSLGGEGAVVVWEVTERTRVRLELGQQGRQASGVDNNSGGEGKRDDFPMWGSIGGLHTQIEQLREAVELPLTRPELFAAYSVKPPRGVLLHGPPGTGKTSLARAAADACGAHVVVVNGPELLSKWIGESEAALTAVFNEARARAPSLIVFDEIDALCPRRDAANTEVERRVVSTLLALLDGVGADAALARVAIIACTNRPQDLDPALRRPGRLDREVEVGVPDVKDRVDILQVLSRGLPCSWRDEDLSEVASRAHGFVGADLKLLLKEAGLIGMRRAQKQGDLSAVSLTADDLFEALALVSPSALREVSVEVPSVRWTDIGGMTEVKQALKEVVEWPLLHPEVFERLGVAPPRGVLLYGPPGCSKTLMAKALATESGMNFLAVKGPELLNKWLGESERAMQTLFKRARAAAPTIIFFDEIDALASRRGGSDGDDSAGATERVLTQLLTELDGVQPLKRVITVAATNRPDIIDPALLRPGRLDRLVYVPPPDLESRTEILRITLNRMPHDKTMDLLSLAQMTEGYSGAEVTALCQEAAMIAIDEDKDVQELESRHILKASKGIQRQITPATLQFYTDFQRRKKNS
ncbi:unnamed protein product [Chrysoparadoxa australica]